MNHKQIENNAVKADNNPRLIVILGMKDRPTMAETGSRDVTIETMNAATLYISEYE
jgi:hypothetical protein